MCDECERLSLAASEMLGMKCSTLCQQHRDELSERAMNQPHPRKSNNTPLSEGRREN